MRSNADYLAALDGLTDGVQPRRGLTREVAAARDAEQRSRASAAQSVAMRALRDLYPDDFRSLRTLARERIDAKRGPLPGDDVTP